MLEVIKEWLNVSCHWKFFTNIRPQEEKKLDETTIFKEKLDHHDYFHICLKEVK